MSGEALHNKLLALLEALMDREGIVSINAGKLGIAAATLQNRLNKSLRAAALDPEIEAGQRDRFKEFRFRTKFAVTSATHVSARIHPKDVGSLIEADEDTVGGLLNWQAGVVAWLHTGESFHKTRLFKEPVDADREWLTDLLDAHPGVEAMWDGLNLKLARD